MDTNPIKYSDLIAPDSSIKDLISQLEKLVATYEDAKGKIQTGAEEQRKAIASVSGATEEQRKTIELVTKASDELMKSYRDLSKEEWQERERLVSLNAAKKEAAQIDKLVSQAINAQEGSYNRLSAQYRLNKITLNKLSAEQRAMVPEYQKLEQETAAIYEEMKRLQEVTGKHTLNVGNYKDATVNLRTEIMQLTQEMAQLRLEGKQNSEEYMQAASRAGQLKDAMMDANKEVKNMASDTQQLDSIMSAASAAGGGFAAYTGLTTLLGSKDEDAAEAQKKLQAAIAITNGVRAVQNALQKQSALMVGIRLLQMKAAVAAENLDTAAKGKNIVVTKAATIAQKAFNAAAKANPYVLLAMALITVVGALVAFASGSSKAAKKQAELNSEMAKYNDLVAQAYEDSMGRVFSEREKAAQRELDLLKAQGASTEEIRAAEDRLMSLRRLAHAARKGYFADEAAELGVNRLLLERYNDELRQAQLSKGMGIEKIDVDGAETEIDDAIAYYQSLVDTYGKKVEIGTSIKTEGEDLDHELALLNARRLKEDQAAAKSEADILRTSLAVLVSLIRDSYSRETREINLNYDKQIADLRYKLQTETTLSVKSRAALNAQIAALEEKRQRELEEKRNAYALKAVQAIRETEDKQIEIMEEGSEKRATQLSVSYQREIEDLQHRLDTEKDLTQAQRDEISKQIILATAKYTQDVAKLTNDAALTRLNREKDAIELRLEAVQEGSEEEINLTLASLEKQRQIELAENAALETEKRQDEAAINAKWDAVILRQTGELRAKRAQMILADAQELAASEFALLDRNERQKTAFEIAQEIERQKQLLALAKAGNIKMTEEQIAALRNTIAALEKEAKRLPYDNMYELLGIGLDSQQQTALNEALGNIKSNIDSIIDSWTAAADAAVKSADKQVSATKAILDAEIEARNAGYANNVELAQKEYEAAQKQREKAVREQEKAQRAQARIDTAMQSSSLITATANIWKALSGVPLIGPGLAIAAIATMWGSFAAAKIKAAQVTKSKSEEYGEGTVELLEGGSHASGHDIDLGTKPDGTRRRAEGGEFFAVINKRNSRRYRSIIPDVINSFNDGTFADKYARASETANLSLNLLGAGRTDVSRLEGDVRAIRRQGETSRQTAGDGSTIIRYKNLTRRLIA